MRKYVNKSVDKILIRRGMDDLRLSVFSTSVNAGLKKAMFKLQQTIKIYPDGLVGPKTLERLSSIDTDKNILNVTYLVNVKYFYDSLISSNPSKYKRFKNGWYARLERLGLNIS
jgi:lysozyme family protein